MSSASTLYCKLLFSLFAFLERCFNLSVQGLIPCSISHIVYVNASVANGGDGTTWSTPDKKLQDATNLACGCTGTKSVIGVAQGTNLLNDLLFSYYSFGLR